METDNKKIVEETAFKQRLYAFTLSLIRLVEDLAPTKTTKVIGDQLLRSGTSVIANYVEAYASSSQKDYASFFHYSLKSANESKLWLSLLRDSNNAQADRVEVLLKELEEIANILGASLLTLKNKR